MRVNLIVDKSKIIYYHLFPLLVMHSDLKKEGLDIKYLHKLDKRVYECDTLIILSKSLFNLMGENKYILDINGPVIKFLKSLNERGLRIIWMDTSDSTSTTHFEILPYVHKYLKKQLFKDRSLYKGQLYGGRIFTDFYHKTFGAIDELPHPDIKLLTDDEHKLGISWNIGLGDMYNAFSSKKKSILYGRYFNLFNPSYNRTHFLNPRKEIDFMLKTTANLSRNTVAFHRQELVRHLKDISEDMNLNTIVQGKRLGKHDFRKAMLSTKIFPSPFGWGEIGVRDYEAFIYQGVLLKPNLDYMETWPDIFINNLTYVPFRWDFTDLEQKINLILNDYEMQQRIAVNGQQKYLESISDNGLSEFFNRFIKIISKS
jgi:hypothetical protein